MGAPVDTGAVPRRLRKRPRKGVGPQSRETVVDSLVKQVLAEGTSVSTGNLLHSFLKRVHNSAPIVDSQRQPDGSFTATVSSNCTVVGRGSSTVHPSEAKRAAVLDALSNLCPEVTDALSRASTQTTPCSQPSDMAWLFDEIKRAIKEKRASGMFPSDGRVHHWPNDEDSRLPAPI
ncbi:DRBM domain-containing protein [Plasmodiophora brassicae]